MNKTMSKNKSSMELHTKSQNAMQTNTQIIAHNPYQNTVESAKWNKQKKCTTNFAILKRKKTAATQKKKRSTKIIGIQKTFHGSSMQHVFKSA